MLRPVLALTTTLSVQPESLLNCAREIDTQLIAIGEHSDYFKLLLGTFIILRENNLAR
jgi:hypothetical protein